MLNAYKYRLHPTREQSEFFNKSFGCVRFIYNWGLQKRIEAYAKDKGRISYLAFTVLSLASPVLFSLKNLVKAASRFLNACCRHSVLTSLNHEYCSSFFNSVNMAHNSR